MENREIVHEYDFEKSKLVDSIGIMLGYVAVLALTFEFVRSGLPYSLGTLSFMLLLYLFFLIASTYGLLLYKYRKLTVYRNRIEYIKTPFQITTINLAEVSDIKVYVRKKDQYKSPPNHIIFEMINIEDKKINFSFLNRRQFEDVAETTKGAWDRD